MLAYRTTFADDKGQFGLWQDALSKRPILAGGFGRDVRERAIAEAVRRGWLDRPRNATLPRGPGQRFARAVDHLHLPPGLDMHNSRMVWRGWFDGTLTPDQMAALLYMHAGTGKGPGVYARELAARFGWSRPTALAVLHALLGRGLIGVQRRTDAKGRVVGVTYAVTLDMTAAASLPTVKNSGHGDDPLSKSQGTVSQGTVSQGTEIQGTYEGTPSDVEDPPRQNKPSHHTPSGGEHRATRGAQDDVGFAKEQIQPLAPERIILANWKSSEFFRKAHESRFTGMATLVMSLERWCGWLDYFGGAPPHLKTAAAHRQASEIAHELGAIGGYTTEAALVGLAYAVCCEHGRGRDIRSLGFIAESLVRKAMVDDDTWAYDMSHRISPEFDQARDLATRVVKALGTFDYGIEADSRELLSTFRLEGLSRMIQDHTWNGVVDAVDYVTRNQLRQADGRIICGWNWFADYIEPAKAAKAAAAAAPPPQPAPPQPAKQGAGSEADVEEACKWLRNYLGDTWHSSQRVSSAARHAGIDREVYLTARARLDCQKGRDSNYQWITALPNVPPPPPAPAASGSDDVMRTIRAADYNCLLAKKLYRQGAEPLLAYARSQAEEHGCTPDDVINVILDVLRRASSQEFGARQRVLESMIGSNCGVGKPRYDIAHWTDFNRPIADAVRRKETA